MLLPFNMPLWAGDGTRPSGAVQAVLTVAPSKELAASTSFWIRQKVLAKKAKALKHCEQALTLVPFWVAVAGASSQRGASNLH